MKAMRLLAILAISFFAAETAMAADYYVRAGASGANNGADWTNAYTALPSTLVRGSTYYIAGGSYPGRTFNTPASGTLIITIKGATAADHGTDTGWSNNYSVETNQAVWTSGVTFNTSYWEFDGSIGPKWSKTPSAYGFSFSAMAYPIRIYNTSSAITNFTISHISAIAPTGDIEKIFLSTDNSTRSVNNVTISYCLGNGWANMVWATSPGLVMDSWLIEYNVILNGYSTAAVHGEDINNNYGQLNNLTVRFNWFEGRGPSTGSIVVLNGAAGPYYIYGNVFKDMRGGDGIITGVHYTLSGAIYNNTFINCDNGYGGGQWIGHDVTATVYNNLIYNSNAAMGSNTTHDYNAFFSTTNTPTESHRQTGSGSPFVNLSAGDLRLSAPTSAGISLSSPYDRDAEGNVRGADAIWERGALEFVGNVSVPNAPTGLVLR
jgi:hypothetical protein